MTDLGSARGILSYRGLANEYEGITYFMFVDSNAWNDIAVHIIFLSYVYAPGLVIYCMISIYYHEIQLRFWISF